MNHLQPKNNSSTSNHSFDPCRKSKLDEVAIKCIIIDGRPFGDFRKRGMSIDPAFDKFFEN